MRTLYRVGTDRRRGRGQSHPAGHRRERPMIDPKIFFDGVRRKLFAGRLSQRQVDGMNAILAEWTRRQLEEPRWLAYMLATVYWETAHTMWPIEEWGHGTGYTY